MYFSSNFDSLQITKHILLAIMMCEFFYISAGNIQGEVFIRSLIFWIIRREDNALCVI